MLYYLFDFLDQTYDLPGAGVFQYITFRAAMAVITSLLIGMVFGKRLIDRLHAMQVGETVRDLGLEGQKEKAGTPTMGGTIILEVVRGCICKTSSKTDAHFLRSKRFRQASRQEYQKASHRW